MNLSSTNGHIMGQAKQRRAEIDAMKNTTDWVIGFHPFIEYAENERVLIGFFEALVPELKAHAHVGKTAIEGTLRAALSLKASEEQAGAALHAMKRLMRDEFNCPTEVCNHGIWLAAVLGKTELSTQMNDAELVKATLELNAPRSTPLQ